ncbi:hypothetical protein THIX_90205 [Thiomonas sp. X19]|nr:hypothetical protein THIX_90205 [Thiomonas sp. X19]
MLRSAQALRLPFADMARAAPWTAMPPWRCPSKAHSRAAASAKFSGAKIAGAPELALRDCEAGRPVRPLLLLETGGARLQEANLPARSNRLMGNLG